MIFPELYFLLSGFGIAAPKQLDPPSPILVGSLSSPEHTPAVVISTLLDDSSVLVANGSSSRVGIAVPAPTVYITTRHASDEVALAKAEEVRSELQAARGATVPVGSAVYLLRDVAFPTQIASLGLDADGRERYGFSAIIFLSQVVG